MVSKIKPIPFTYISIFLEAFFGAKASAFIVKAMPSNNDSIAASIIEIARGYPSIEGSSIHDILVL